jgi:Asp-tRNA(Asn)/Glu-tRNA(Gln) amidotransferase A subunit family amidase
MDKLGPICRGVEDCALVLAAINGPDGLDRTIHDVPFNWDATLDPHRLRIGYLKKDFEHAPEPDEKPDDRERREMMKKFDAAALDVLQGKLGLKLIPAELPEIPWDGIRVVLDAEAAAAFDDLTRTGRDKLLTEQGPQDWPNAFRVAHFIPAVEYVNANRARMVALEKMAKFFADYDVIVTPTWGPQLVATNLTGYPAVIVPSGFRPDGTSVSLTFLGNLFGEAKMLAVAKAYQDATDWHLRKPELKG